MKTIGHTQDIVLDELPLSTLWFATKPVMGTTNAELREYVSRQIEKVRYFEERDARRTQRDIEAGR